MTKSDTGKERHIPALEQKAGMEAEVMEECCLFLAPLACSYILQDYLLMDGTAHHGLGPSLSIINQ